MAARNLFHDAVNQRNMTEVDLARKFVQMGVSEDDIVLELHPPYKRPQTGFGVA